MAGQILATKLYLPPPPPKVIARARLIGRMDQGRSGKVTLISTPPGFGKTTLVSSWIAAQAAPAAWISLDEGDSDPRRFLTYLIAALQRIAPQVGASLVSALDASPLPPVEAILTVLLNDLAATGTQYLLVLEDYHAIDAAEVDRVLTFLVEHMPAGMHLVITTREDPQLPLSRWRVRGQLTELRAADLSFTPTEAALFLSQVMEVAVPHEVTEALEARTEGWVAGLQLAALSMRGRSDMVEFVRDFAGDNRHIADYLVEEVLQRQRPEVRTFLLATSLLERLCGPLCDAVTGRNDGVALLETLERNNLFVVPLDDRRHWFRYHHLFATVLAARARHERPELVPEWHRRASLWYAANEMPADAIEQALAGRDFTRAADLLEEMLPEIRQGRQEATLRTWASALPQDVLRQRPMLSIHYAGALMQTGALDGVEELLRNAEQYLAIAERNRHDGDPDDLRLSLLAGWVAIYRAGQALIVGAFDDSAVYAQRALERLPREEPMGRGAAAALLGISHWNRGDLEAAYQTYAEGMTQVQQAGFVADAVGSAIILADIRIAQGRLREAMQIYERGLALATAQRSSLPRGAADMYVGMATLHCEQNDLESARRRLAQGDALGELAGLPQYPWRRRVAMANIHVAEGDPVGALALLDEAELRYVPDFAPNVRPVGALKTQIWLALGRVNDSVAWAHSRGLSPREELSYLNEFEHLILARILLARAQSERSPQTALEAQTLLEALLQRAVEGERTGSVVEILNVLALAHHAQGATESALGALERALALAEPEDYVRLFVDEGPTMQALLREALVRGVFPLYTQQLLNTFAAEPASETTPPVHPLSTTDTPQTFPSPHGAAPLEPLSQREIEVLRLFRTELSGPEIADELVIALSTLRTHTKSIYGKLGVNSRRAAVNRAIELHLI